jgi:ribulose 1,5-bisphosphate synthetase/thiazole synthase
MAFVFRQRLNTLKSAWYQPSAIFRHASSQQVETYDIGIVGGGIVGLATARELKIRFPDAKIRLFEKVV